MMTDIMEQIRKVLVEQDIDRLREFKELTEQEDDDNEDDI